jgi:hypothetical protein
MPSIQLTGSIPESIRENSRRGDWQAALAVTGDTDRVVAVEVQNTNGLNFTASWDALRKLAILEPAALLDFESFAAGGRQPLLSFTLRFVFDDGSRQGLPTPIRIAVLDVDDTPPAALRFASGGSVTAGAIGATIGTLAVTDPDSAGPFGFTFAEEDSWRFEVVGTTLKLRDGISLGLDDMPNRPLFVAVSDGRQSAAFTLDLRVLDPGGFQSIMPGGTAGDDSRGGFAVAPDGAAAFALKEARSLVAANRYEDAALQVTLAAGGEVWLPAIGTLRLADGLLEFGAAGPAARAAALHEAVLGREAGGRDLAGLLAQAEGGMAWAEIARGMLPLALKGLGDAALVQALFRAGAAREATPGELALHTGRLASGISREQLAADIALGEALVGGGNPHWVFAPLGSAGWRADPGGLAPPAPAAASAAWLF